MSLLDDFKFFNRVRIANGCVQIILLVTLLLGLQLTLLALGEMRDARMVAQNRGVSMEKVFRG